MITLFSIPRAFSGIFGTIQRNALLSWKKLEPCVEVILLGDEAGVAEIADELGYIHQPDIALDDNGKPLMNDMFEKAQGKGTNDVFCYINSDVILLNNFMHAVQLLLLSSLRDNFLMIGSRWELAVNKSIMFSDDWEAAFKIQLYRYGSYHPPTGTDYVLFPRGFFQAAMPPFPLGCRCAADNWKIGYSLKKGAAVIDCSPAVTVVHQEHPRAKMEQDTQSYIALAGGYDRFNLLDATHALTSSGLIALDTGQQTPEEFLTMIRAKSGGRKIAVFGAGAWGEALVRLFVDSDLKPAKIVDNNERKWGKVLGGIEIANPLILNREYFIVIASDAMKEIGNQLALSGFTMDNDFVQGLRQC